MALVKKIKLSLYEKRPFDLEIKQGARVGQKVSGFLYKGFTPEGATFQFSSPNVFDVHDLSEFDAASALEFTLYGKQFKNDEPKWSTQRPE